MDLGERIVLITEDDGRMLVASVRFAKLDKGPACVGFSIRSYGEDGDPVSLPSIDADPSELGAVYLHRVAFGSVIAEARNQMRVDAALLIAAEEWTRRSGGKDLRTAEKKTQAQAWSEGALGRRRRRPKFPEAHWREVATTYLEAADTGAPVRAVQKRMTARLGREVPIDTARRWVKRSRELGLIPPTSPGLVSRKSQNPDKNAEGKGNER